MSGEVIFIGFELFEGSDYILQKGGKYVFFNEIMKFGDIFENQETIDELNDISDEIKMQSKMGL